MTTREDTTTPRADRSWRSTVVQGVDLLTRVSYWAACITLFALLALIMINVLLRDVASSGIQGTVAYSQMALALVIFGGLGETERRDSHIRVRIVENLKLRSGLILWVRRILLVVIGIGLLFFAWQSFTASLDSLDRGEYMQVGGVRLSLFPTRLIIAVGLLINALQSISRGIFATDDTIIPTLALEHGDGQEGVEDGSSWAV